MGKSSLMVRTAARLRRRASRVAILDLTAIGQNLTAEQWYERPARHAGRAARPGGALEDWLERTSEPAAAMDRALRARWSAAGMGVPLGADSLLAALPAEPRLVIFIDEIDAVPQPALLHR